MLHLNKTPKLTLPVLVLCLAFLSIFVFIGSRSLSIVDNLSQLAAPAVLDADSFFDDYDDLGYVNQASLNNVVWDNASALTFTPVTDSSNGEPIDPSSSVGQGLLGLWRFDGNAGDASGNNRAGTLRNNPTFSNGVYDQALVLNGTNSVAVPSDSVLAGPPAVTLALWFYNSAWPSSGYRSLAGKSNWSDNREYRLRLDAGQLVWHVNADGGSNFREIKVPLSAFSAGEWHHIAGTWDSATGAMNLYVDGASVGSSTFSAARLHAGSANFAVGSSGNDAGNGLDRVSGLFDEVALWNRALASSEISQLAEAGGGSSITSGSFESVALATGIFDTLTADWNETVAGASSVSFSTNNGGTWCNINDGQTLTSSNCFGGSTLKYRVTFDEADVLRSLNFDWTVDEVPTTPIISTSQSSLTYSSQVGQNPANQTLVITNSGGGTLNWIATDNAPWLTLSPTSGTNQGTITASVNASGLSAGTYQAVITITTTGAATKTIPVTLSLSTEPPPPTGDFVVSRISGVAPLAVFFDATSYNGNITRYEWDFGDPGSGDLNNQVEWFDHNKAEGFVAAHVFDPGYTRQGPGGIDVSGDVDRYGFYTGSPLTYQVTLKITDESGSVETKTRYITVNGFSGNTFCVSPSNDFNDCPDALSANRFTSHGAAFSAINANSKVKPGDRVLYHRGETFPYGGNTTASYVSDVVISAYGNGAKPLLQYTGLGDRGDRAIGIGQHSHRVSIMDLKVNAKSTSTDNFYGSGFGIASGGYQNTLRPTDDILLLRTDYEDVWHGGDFTTWISELKNIFLIDSTVTGGHGNQAHLVIGNGSNMALLNNKVGTHYTLGTGNQWSNNFYLGPLRKAVISGNLGVDPRDQVIRITANSGTTNDVVVSDNIFDAEGSEAALDLRQSGSAGVTNNVLIERNMILNAFHNVRIAEGYQNITLRNNIIDSNNTAGSGQGTLWFLNGAVDWPIIGPISNVFIYNNVIANSKAYPTIGIEVRSSELVYGATHPQIENLRLYNNVIYGRNSSPNLRAIKLALPSYASQLHMDNNLFYYPNKVDGNLFEISGVAHDLNTWRSRGFDILSNIGNPLFASPDFSSPAGYRVNASSWAVNNGADLIGVRSDFDGLTRPQGAGWDIGAFEYGSGGPTTPVISTTPSTLTFASPVGSNPANQTIGITNAGGGTLTWQASDNAPWLTLTPTSGTNQGTITASVSTTGLSAGTHQAVITITATGATTKTIPVTLTLTTVTPDPDTTAPTVAITAPAAGASLSGSTAITVSATDPTVVGQTTSGVKQVDFRIGGVTVALDTTSPYGTDWDTGEVENGTYVISAVAEDVAGNTSTSNPISVTVENVADYTLTTTAVNGTIIKNPNQATYPAGTTVTLTATPNTNYQFDSWSGDLSGTANPTTITMTGPKSVTANFSSVVVPDTTPPTTISDLATLAVGQTNLDLTWTAPTDDTAVTSYDLRYATSPITSTNWSNATQVTNEPTPAAPGTTELLNLTGLTPSTTYYAALRSRDAAGNESALSNVVTWTMLSATNPDTTAPIINLTSPTNGQTLGGQVAVMASASDPTVAGQTSSGVKQVTFKLDGADLAIDASSPYSTVWDTSTYPNGSYVITATAEDAAGNAATANPVTVTIDNQVTTYSLTTTATNGTITKSPDQETYSPNAQVTLTAVPDTGYRFTGWSGDLVGTINPILLIMNGPKSITANFSSIVVTDTTPPTAVSDLATLAVGQTNLDLTWTAPTDNIAVTSYDLRYATSPITSTNWSNATQVTNEPTPAAPGTTELLNLTGLTPSTTYYAALRSRDAAGNESALSNVVSWRTANSQTPPVISGITVSGITETEATITWQTNEPADTQIRYGLSTTYNQAIVPTSDLTTSHRRTLLDLTPGATYHFQVRSRNAEGIEARSADQTFETVTPEVIDTIGPAKIDDLAVSSTDRNSATLTWTAPTDDLPGPAAVYELRYSESSITADNWTAATLATGLPAPATPGASESYVLVGLANNRTYYVALRGMDAAGNWSDLSNLLNFTTRAGGGGGGGGGGGADRVDPVTDLSVEVNEDQALLSWQNPTRNYVRVLVLRSTEALPGNLNDPRSLEGTVIIYEGREEEAIDLEVTLGETYYYTAYAYNSSGRYSSPISRTVAIPTEASLSISDSGSRSLTENEFLVDPNLPLEERLRQLRLLLLELLQRLLTLLLLRA